MSRGGSAVTYGRGGAGNVTTRNDQSPRFEPESTPTLKSKKYTTGRGGAGNMAKNDFDHPEEARRAQDVDVPGITLPEGSFHTGRGGMANTYKPTDEELQAAKSHNEKSATATDGPPAGLGIEEQKTKPRQNPLQAVKEEISGTLRDN
ncbi:hypothetical protein KCU88_g2409, partial [Aureobasidium melanogenum]